MMPALELLGGIAYLLMGGDLLVRGSVALSRRFRVSPAIVAFTVVAFGTSVPELVVGLRAARTGLPELALGNVVGSNIANVLLVVGATAVIYPLATTDRSGRRDSIWMLGAGLLMASLAWGGSLHRGAGLVLLAFLGVSTALSARSAVRSRVVDDPSTPIEWVLGMPRTLPMIVLFLAAGLVGLPLGARLMIEGSVEIATALGVSNTVIGLTLVAISTSLPELATTIVAAFQRRTELVLGTVVGSNIFNVLGIMGASSLASPEPVPVLGRAITVDIPVMLLASLLLAVLVWRSRPIGRRVGIVLLGLYTLYLFSFV
jgi:cation:H+ antiporter